MILPNWDSKDKAFMKHISKLYKLKSGNDGFKSGMSEEGGGRL